MIDRPTDKEREERMIQQMHKRLTANESGYVITDVHICIDCFFFLTLSISLKLFPNKFFKNVPQFL